MNEWKWSNTSIQYVEKILNKRERVVIWGCGKNFVDNIDFIAKICDIVAVYDKSPDVSRQFSEFQICDKASEIKSYSRLVIITVLDDNAKRDIAKILDEEEINFVFLEDLIGIYKRRRIRENTSKITKEIDYQEYDKMKSYIGILIPEYVCNLNCRYCYISQTGSKLPKITKMDGVARHLGEVLSKENLGGAALVGLCGTGETLLGDSFQEICIELLKAGHFLHIVTNGLLTDKIIELIECADKYAPHIMFKLSFHYEELKRRNMLMKFVDTVNYIEKSKASYTIELMPHDEIIPEIEDIKQFSYKYFGALPHVTIGRNNTDGFSLLSKLSDQEYYDTWKDFDSCLFDYKMRMYQAKGCDCYAGKYGLNIELENGSISRCTTVEENIGNIYEMDTISLTFDKMENKCPLSYCYNCHVYGPLGIMLKDREVPTYLEMRDRVREDGTHWIKEPMANFINQKIYENYQED